MIDRLRSHLKSEKGFTLIELLVVIAIIAVLVVIAIVAINPLQRIRDGQDRAARSNVRSTGTLVATCMTRALSGDLGGAGDATQCDSNVEVETNGEGNVPGTVSVIPDASAGTTDVCAWQQGSADNWYRYEHETGTTEEIAGTAPATDALRCP